MTQEPREPQRPVVFINPRATYFKEISQKCYPPLHLLYLSAALRRQGFAAEVIDANAFRLTDEQIRETLVGARPFLVGISVYSEILPQIRRLIDLARAACPGARIVLGGPHATAVPETTLKQFPKADVLLTGEAEETLPLLCRALLDHREPADVPGVFFRSGDGGIRSGPAHRLPDVNALPWPDRDLVDRAYQEKRYYSILVRNRPVDTLFTSRGCPFRCGFCYNFRRHYRTRTPDDVLQELAAIRGRGIRDVEICDDTFTVDEGHALAVFDGILREKLDISFRIKSRVDVFTERIAQRGREAGVYLVAFGMESGSQQMLDRMGKKITLEQIARACDLTRRYGILSHSGWILGYPGETPDTIEETARFILKVKPTTANIDILRPYPNTPVYDQAKADGTLVGDWTPEAAPLPWIRLPWARDRAILDAARRNVVRRVYFTPHYMTSFAGQILKNANVLLARYAWQETLRLLFRKRGQLSEGWHE